MYISAGKEVRPYLAIIFRFPCITSTKSRRKARDWPENNTGALQSRFSVSLFTHVISASFNLSNKTALRYPIRDWTDAGSFHIVGDKRRAQIKKEPKEITLKLLSICFGGCSFNSRRGSLFFLCLLCSLHSISDVILNSNNKG